MIKIKNLTKFYSNNKDKKKKYIFKDFSLKVEKNEIVGLFGQNGSGKSTLLNIINNTDDEYVGSAKVLSKKISYVYQKPTDTLLPWYTCKENILLALDYQKLDRIKGESLLEELSEKLKIDFSLYSYPFELSGGQQQVVAILRAFITEPDIILLDEPFAALDIERRINIVNLFKLYKNKITVVMTSHRGDEISDILDRAIVLKNQPVNIINDFSLKNMEKDNFQEKVNKIRFNENEKK